MKKLFFSFLALCCGPLLHAQQLTVSSKCDIFLAGQSEQPRDEPWKGLLPVAVPLNGAQYITIDSVSGRISCAETFNTADGGACVTTETDINSVNGIAGILHHRKTMFLVGLFINEQAFDLNAPEERLDCTNYDGFKVLKPGLEQVFFIGDGRNSRKELQQFQVPKGATMLYLGFVDAPAFHGDYGTYDDNDGRVKLSVKQAGQ